MAARSQQGVFFMSDYNRLNHTTWDCKYHVVFIPKYRKKVLFGQVKRRLIPVLQDLAARKECRIEEGHMMVDHVHLLISIPPKYAVSSVVGFIKGKSAIWVAQNIDGRSRNFTGAHFWARGYFSSTVGRDEELIRRYIRDQEIADKQHDHQHNLFH
jgi:putative transposase